MQPTTIPTTVATILLLLSLALPALAQNAPGLLGKSVNIKGEDEYAPYISYGQNDLDTLFFTSSRSVPGERRRVLQARIFFSTRPVARRNGPITEGWSDAKLLSSADSKFSSFTQGATVVTKDRIVFAADRNLSNLGTSAQLELWEMVRTGNTFSKPEPIDEVNDPNAWDSQPALSGDGKTLFFVSNRKGGKGARDIWYSRLGEDGRWSSPQPVPNVNTPGDEFSPFSGPDGRFYFSTNWDFAAGKVGTRKKEIHRAELSWAGGAPTPSNPMNLDDAIRNDAGQYDIGLGQDFRINSDEDDEFPFITPDRKAIFLSSGRKGGFGGQDIYAFALPSSRIRLQVRVVEQLLDSSGAELSERRVVSYPVEVTDSTSSQSARKLDETTWLLEPDRPYSVALTGISPDDCFDVQVYNTPRIGVRSGMPYGGDTLLEREFLVTRRRISVPQIVFQATETLPYFITGYWWPNTTENLKRFDDRNGNGFFENSGFIQRDDYDYDGVAKQISSIFEERLYRPLDKLLPRFTARCADTLALVVTVHGYTDPRRLRSPHNYPDETVNVGVDMNNNPVSIVSGTTMFEVDPKDAGGHTIPLKNHGEQGNVILSKLRAYYTFRTLDTMMKQRSPVYAQLARSGRVVLDAEGYGKYRDDVPDDDPMSRRIEIYLDAVPLSQVAEFKRLRGGEIRGAKIEKWRPNKPAGNVIATDGSSDEPKDKPEVTHDEAPVVTTETTEVASNDDEFAPPCYAIQFCSLSDAASAQEKAKILADRGVTDARVELFTNRGGGKMYRVRAGCYSTAEEASRALNDLTWTFDALSLSARPVIVR